MVIVNLDDWWFELELSTTVSEQSIDGGFELNYEPSSKKIRITADGADVASISDFQTLVQGITYNNTHQGQANPLTSI